MIKDSKEAAAYLAGGFKGRKREAIKALLLDGKKEVLLEETLAVGKKKEVVFDGAEAGRYAKMFKAKSAYLAHNHPSGIMLPSEDDSNMTTAMNDIYASVGTKLEDHIIFGPDGKWVSMKELAAKPFNKVKLVRKR